jgi:3-oxoacyl-[acyl-carrier protein] reductase
LVTGASGGSGAATAESLAREGASVVVLDRPGTESEASKLVRRIGGSQLLVDITDEAAPAFIRDTLLQRYGGADIVVHNAGVTQDKTLSRLSSEAWTRVLDVNLRAVQRITAALLDGGCLRDDGRLILLSSVGGIAGNVGQANYAASKAALIGYARALAVQLAPRAITVNAVAPGFIETRMTAKMPVPIREAARRLSSLNQGGTPQDVAEAITFLAMPTAYGCTGQALRVCGGALIGA